MKIVPYHQQAQAKLLAFQKAQAFENIRLFEADSETGHTVYLEENAQILGIASRFRNMFHPQFEQLQFAVAPRNDTYMTLLYEAIKQGKPASDTPFEILLNQTYAQHMTTFLARHGFSLILKSECPQIALAESAKQLIAPALPKGYRLETYNRLDEIESKMLRIFRLAGYAKTHFWSPPLSLESPYWQETDVNQKDQTISWAVLKNKAIVLCSDAHIEGDEVYLGWGWHDDAYEASPDLKGLWSNVLKRQIEFCLQTGKRLIGEFDSLDTYGQYKSALLSHLTSDTYFIYQQTLNKK